MLWIIWVFLFHFILEGPQLRVCDEVGLIKHVMRCVLETNIFSQGQLQSVCDGYVYIGILIDVLTRSLSWDAHRCQQITQTWTHTHSWRIHYGSSAKCGFSLLYSDSNLLKPIIRVKGCLFVFLRSASFCFNVGSEREGSVAHKRELECRSHPSYFQFFPHDERESPEVFISQPTAPPPRSPSPSARHIIAGLHKRLHFESILRNVFYEMCQRYWFVLRRGGQRG